MKRHLLGTLSIMLAAVGLSAVAITAGAEGEAVTPSLPAESLQRQLDELVESDAATAALLRLEDGRHHWSGSAGLGRLDGSGVPDPDGFFRIGSITKTFAATVILQLADEGALDIDDAIEAHLPGLVPDGDQITVRQILDHSSGLYDYMSEPGYSTNRWRGEQRFDHFDAAELLEVAFAKPPHFPPGTDWRYSNTNYIVAGLLIEKLTGDEYAGQIDQRILRPLGLSDTMFPGDEAGLPEPHAHGYAVVVEGEGVVDATEMNPSLDWAAGEAISTTADLNTFMAGLLGGELTSAKALEQMRIMHETGTVYGYGVGLQRFTLPCGVDLYGHSGQLLGYTTYAVRADDGRVLSLSYNPSATAPSQEVLLEVFTTAFCRGMTSQRTG